jgi:uncharacterized membrane-anchored protein YitT (DUF2179 family)
MHYASGISFGKVFFVLNLPFYVLAWKRMERAFVLKTIAAVALLSLLAEWTPHWVRFEQLDPVYASVLGGVLLGVGFLMLFRHRASLGGVGILAFTCKKAGAGRPATSRWRSTAPSCWLALWTAPLLNVALSVAGAVVLNLILAMNHRKDRYIGP